MTLLLVGLVAACYRTIRAESAWWFLPTPILLRTTATGTGEQLGLHDELERRWRADQITEEQYGHWVRRVVTTHELDGSFFSHRSEWPRDLPIVIYPSQRAINVLSSYPLLQRESLQVLQVAPTNAVPPESHDGSSASWVLDWERTPAWKIERIWRNPIILEPHKDPRIVLRLVRGIEPPRVSYQLRLTLPIQLVDTIDDVITPISGVELDTTLADEMDLWISASGGDPALRPMLQLKYPSVAGADFAVAVLVEVFHSDQLVAWQRIRHVDNYWTTVDRSMPTLEGDWQRIRDNRDGWVNWTVRVRDDPERALLDFEHNRYWSGSLTMPLRVVGEIEEAWKRGEYTDHE